MSARPDINWLIGASDESYGTQVWIGRVESLKCWIQLLRGQLPSDVVNERVGGLFDKAISEANGYIADAVPSDMENAK